VQLARAKDGFSFAVGGPCDLDSAPLVPYARAMPAVSAVA